MNVVQFTQQAKTIQSMHYNRQTEQFYCILVYTNGDPGEFIQGFPKEAFFGWYLQLLQVGAAQLDTPKEITSNVDGYVTNWVLTETPVFVQATNINLEDVNVYLLSLEMENTGVPEGTPAFIVNLNDPQPVLRTLNYTVSAVTSGLGGFSSISFQTRLDGVQVELVDITALITTGQGPVTLTDLNFDEIRIFGTV